jgi:hypothetical protein
MTLREERVQKRRYIFVVYPGVVLRMRYVISSLAVVK